ncbi:DUF6538 domain-containing protein [Stenotrophomonas sp. JAG2]|uniref:DUF6538 domain-containing protein n=1 Tax=Stenotrophomonas sp. JAG2 TaxID=3229243 RepID=UPI0034E1BCCF
MRIPHHLIRSPAGRWSFRQRVPSDLQARLGQTVVKRSLRTTDLRQAQLQAIIFASLYAQVFDADRALPMDRIEHLTIKRFSTDYKEVPTEPIGLLLGIPSSRLRAAPLRMEQRYLIESCGGKATFINCTKMFAQSRSITWR